MSTIHELPRGVSVILYREGSFAISQRLDTEGHSGRFQFPGGHIEAGELAIRGAQRELAEETGLELPLQRFIFLGRTEPLTGYSGETYIGWRYAVLTKEEEPQRTEPTKATEWIWYCAEAMVGLDMLQQTQNYAFAFHAGLRAGLTEQELIAWLNEPDTILEAVHDPKTFSLIGWYATHRNSPAVFANTKIEAIRGEIKIDAAVNEGTKRTPTVVVIASEIHQRTNYILRQRACYEPNWPTELSRLLAEWQTQDWNRGTYHPKGC